MTTSATKPRRQSAREHYDALVGLMPDDEHGQCAYALVKLHYQIPVHGSVPRLLAPVALEHPLEDDAGNPTLHAGSDFWNTKLKTDIVVLGNVCTPDAKPLQTLIASVTVGTITKRVQVFGDRVARWRADRVEISDAAPFTTMPMRYAHAYGGIDPRVPVENEDDPVVQMNLMGDHPGFYPRNHEGRGYWVMPGAREHEVPMPNLENPLDLLTAQRLVVGDPRRWYKQPLPWCFEWTPIVSFPRYSFAGAAPWYPVAANERLLEVELGLLEADYHTALPAPFEGVDMRFRQGGGPGMCMPYLKPGTPVSVLGMNPSRPSLTFVLPEAPRMEWEIDGRRSLGNANLHSVVVYPNEERFTVLYGAREPMPRPFILGLHKHIPLALRVHGDAPIAFEAPKTIRQELEESKQQGTP